MGTFPTPARPHTVAKTRLDPVDASASAMKSRRDIIAWLTHVDPNLDFPHAEASSVRKPSPPESQSTKALASKRHTMPNRGGPASKKRKLEDTGHDGTNKEDDNVGEEQKEASKKFKFLRHVFKKPTNHPRSLPSQSELQSGTSVAPPTQRTGSTPASELNPDGIETRTLSPVDPRLPKALTGLLFEIEECSIGVGLVSRSRKDEIDAQLSDPSFSIFKHIKYADPKTRDKLGVTPSVSDVLQILKDAMMCQNAKQAEENWNLRVLFPLLSKAIGYDDGQLVGIELCTTAVIIKEYLPTNTSGKMIDFCLFLNPENGPSCVEKAAAISAIQALREVLPFNAINHTDFYSLRNRPIAISIETKKRGGKEEEAELHMGTWHAAQWKLLSWLVSDAGGTLETLPFLPAIVVQGHEWSLVATTREKQKTILWLERRFGSTTSALGIYQIVWGLQRLARWAEDTYSPWFKKNALGIRDLDGLPGPSVSEEEDAAAATSVF